MDLQESFSQDELHMVFLLAPRGLVITLRGDLRSVAKEPPPIVDTDVLPPGPLFPGGPRGVKQITAGIRRLFDWRHFLNLLASSPDQVRTQLLTHPGPGSVSILH